MTDHPTPPIGTEVTVAEIRAHIEAQSKLLDDFVTWGEWATARIEELEAKVAECCFHRRVIGEVQ